MTIRFVISMLLLCCINLSCQVNNKSYNLDFEKINNNTNLPNDWTSWGIPDYSINIDTINVFSGKYSMVIKCIKKSNVNSSGGFGFLIPANYKAG